MATYCLLGVIGVRGLAVHAHLRGGYLPRPLTHFRRVVENRRIVEIFDAGLTLRAAGFRDYPAPLAFP